MATAIIRYHKDLDGMAAAVIAKHGLKKMGYDVKLIPGRNLSFNEAVWLSKQNAKLYLFLDVGAEHGEIINRVFRGKRVWIFDHHRRFDHELPNVDFYINPSEKGRDSLYYATTSAITFKAMREMNLVGDKYSILGIIGAYADIADFGGKLDGLNREVEEIACDGGIVDCYADWTANFKFDLPIGKVIDANYYPIPRLDFMEKLPEKIANEMWYRIKNKEEVFKHFEDIYEDPRWAIAEVPHFHNVEIHDVVTGIKNYGKIDLQLSALNSIVKRGYFTYKSKKYHVLGSRAKPVYRIEVPNYHIILSDDKFIPGVKITFVATRYLKDKPVLGISRYNGVYFITARMHPDHYEKRDLGREMYELITPLGGYGGGHRMVGGGGGLDEEGIAKFMDLIS